MEEINDLIILGRSWPELLRDGRYSVCVAGYSKEHGFVRLYPTRIFSPLKTWNIVNVKIERNSMDTRKESWKIVGSKKDFKLRPYITYRCLPSCASKSPHNRQLIEWGVYMWLNKQKLEEDQKKIFENLRLKDKNWEKYFLVGNLTHKRKTFAIISIMRFKT